MLITPTIQEIPTTSDAAHAFRLRGRITTDDPEAMARHMGAAFERRGKVDVLLLLPEFDGQ